MTQKGELFKGQKKKSAAASRHGKSIHVRKGKVFKEPKKTTTDMEMNKEIAKFINQANEAKAAALAVNGGSRLKIVKAPEGADEAPAFSNKKSKAKAKVKAPSKSQS